MLFGFVYLTARRLIRDPALAALATFSFSAIYVVGYYSHHDLTHTTAMSALLAASWYVFVRLCEAPGLRWYLALGACFGLGILGKWNFAIFAVALPVACLAHPAYRPLVLTWRIVPAALVTAAIVLPSALWALKMGPAEGDAIGSLFGERGGSVPFVLAKGTASLAVALLVYPLPFLAIFLLLFGPTAWRGFKAPAAAGTAPVSQPIPSSTLIAMVMGAAIALHWLLVPIAGLTQFPERLLQPVLLILPVYLFMLLERGLDGGGPSALAVRRYARALAGLAGLALLARIGIHAAGADYCRGVCRDLLPVEALADGLRHAGFSGKGTIVAAHVHLAGNLRVQFPEARVMEVAYPARVWPKPLGTGQCIAVWTGEERLVDTMRARVHAYLAGELGVTADTKIRAGIVTAPYANSQRSYRLFYELYAGPQGECR
jgi:hypothetical protein